ncbi:MAG: hypothetical protein MPW14_17810 [Candidatus Manganitrophus sp.]|nr:MAG: hypothetical protein MPW14_17810 [Candidatus Manganitrophus sp.]
MLELCKLGGVGDLQQSAGNNANGAGLLEGADRPALLIRLHVGPLLKLPDRNLAPRADLVGHSERRVFLRGIRPADLGQRNQLLPLLLNHLDHFF